MKKISFSDADDMIHGRKVEKVEENLTSLKKFTREQEGKVKENLFSLKRVTREHGLNPNKSSNFLLGISISSLVFSGLEIKESTF